MDSKITIGLFLIIAIGVFFIGRCSKDAEIVQVDYNQRELDSLTSVITNQRTSRQALLDSLGETSEAFRDYIADHEGEVASLTRLRGRLNLRIDSLQDRNASLSAIALLTGADSGRVFKDTTITTRQVFGDSLLEAQSDIIIKNDSLSNKLKINQLRQVRLDLAILVNEDQSIVEALATSPDFDSLTVGAQTTLEPPKDKPVKKAINTAAIVVVVLEAIRLIF